MTERKVRMPFSSAQATIQRVRPGCGEEEEWYKWESAWYTRANRRNTFGTHDMQRDGERDGEHTRSRTELGMHKRYTGWKCGQTGTKWSELEKGEGRNELGRERKDSPSSRTITSTFFSPENASLTCSQKI